MTQARSKLSAFFLKVSFYTTALTCLSIPLSTSFTSIFSGLTVLFWLLSGKFLDFTKTLARHPQAAVSFFLAVLFCLGLLYTPADLDYALDILKKYRELLFIPIILSLFFQKPKEAKFAINGFIFGLIILLSVSCLIHFHLIPYKHEGDSHIFHITHSFFMAILAFIALHRTFTSKQYILFWLLIFLAASFNLFIISPGRTGMLVYMVLSVVFLMQKLSWGKLLLGIAAISLLATGLYMGSHNVSTRVDEAVKEIHNYKPGISRTSIGQRFDWYENSVELIKEKPIFGHGTGSFKDVQGDLIKGKDTKPTDNPHNEYLFIGVQLGLVGLSTYIALLIIQFISSFNLNDESRYLAQGVVISMAVGCLMNSFLFDSLQGHFYAFLIALCSSAVHQHSTLTIRK